MIGKWLTMQSCTQCPIREISVCHSLSADKLDELSRTGRRQTLAAGQTLMWQGDEAVLVGNVIDGTMKLAVSSPDGRDQMLGIAYPGDFIGRAFGSRNLHSVTAVTDSQVCTFRRSTFDGFARHQSNLEHDLLERTLTELDRVRQWMLMLGRMNAAQRVASFLIETASRLRPEDASKMTDIQVTLPFGRQEIADLLGLTIETVSRQFTALRKNGTIDIPGRRSIVIRDRRALEVCAAGN